MLIVTSGVRLLLLHLKLNVFSSQTSRVHCVIAMGVRSRWAFRTEEGAEVQVLSLQQCHHRG